MYIIYTIIYMYYTYAYHIGSTLNVSYILYFSMEFYELLIFKNIFYSNKRKS